MCLHQANGTIWARRLALSDRFCAQIVGQGVL
jgi:hypothetical protein